MHRLEVLIYQTVDGNVGHTTETWRHVGAFDNLKAAIEARKAKDFLDARVTSEGRTLWVRSMHQQGGPTNGR